MSQNDAPLPGLLLLVKNYLPESAFSGDNVYPVLVVSVLVFQLFRYFVIACGIFWLVWRVFKQRNAPYKLDPRPLDIVQIKREIGWSLSCTTVLFSFVAASIVWLRKSGYTKIYGDVNELGIPYLVSSVLVMLMIHDLYFYIIHRAMHTQLLYRIFHKVHHLSVDPTPFASFAFHPFEAVLEAGIAYICILTLPIHPYALLAFQTASFLINVYGHLGYEFSQSRTTVYAVWNPLRYINRTCHHHDHHKRCVQSRAHSLLLAPRCITLLRSGGGCKSGNFGLYTTVWDHLFSTMLTAPPLKPRD